MGNSLGVIDLMFRKWLRKRPCDICRRGNWNDQKGEWQNQVMHIKARGMGGKGQKCDDAGGCITACFDCHIVQSHNMTKAEFEEKAGVNLDEIATHVWEAWSGK